MSDIGVSVVSKVLEQFKENENRRGEAGEILQERKIRMARFINTGNAGGTVAVMSLIGTTIRGGSGVYPEPFFWILVVFIVGLVLSLGGHLALVEEQKRRIALMDADDPLPDEVEESFIEKPRKLFDFTVRAAGGILVAGTSAGLWQLYLFAG